METTSASPARSSTARYLTHVHSCRRLLFQRRPHYLRPTNNRPVFILREPELAHPLLQAPSPDGHVRPTRAASQPGNNPRDERERFRRGCYKNMRNDPEDVDSMVV